MGPFCGNGFLEDGEECDCGPEEYCKNRCCIASACKLSVNATCGHGNCCDLGKCTLKPMATTCREPANECDLPEFCDGHTGTCPGDFWVIDGTGCKNGQVSYMILKRPCICLWKPHQQLVIRCDMLSVSQGVLDCHLWI